VEFHQYVLQQLLQVAKAHPGLTVEELSKMIPVSKRQLERICSAESGLTPRAFITAGQ
jgi:AraC-like DNA-binding protein